MYREAVAARGKTGYVSAWREMFIAETREEAIRIARPHVEWLYQDRAASGHSQELPEADRIDVGFEQVLNGRFIIGSPDECAAEIEKYRELGIEELVLRCQWPECPTRIPSGRWNCSARKCCPDLREAVAGFFYPRMGTNFH